MEIAPFADHQTARAGLRNAVSADPDLFGLGSPVINIENVLRVGEVFFDLADGRTVNVIIAVGRRQH